MKEIDFNKYANEIHQIAVQHGWWEKQRIREPLSTMMLMVSEITEANFAVCEYGFCDITYVGDKPEGTGVELVDCVIRILDYFGYNKWDICNKRNTGFDLIVPEETVTANMMMMVNDISEACEYYRKKGEVREDEHGFGVGFFLSRCIWRIKEYMEFQRWDLEKILKSKIEYNRSRPYRHGDKRA